MQSNKPLWGKLQSISSINQIQHLKDRGMDLDYEESKIKEFLLDIGYYRLGFYWNPFEKDDEHNFIDGTKFSTVIKLYYMDVDLRNILSRYINRIEINFRTKLVYYVSNANKNSPTWFADPTIIGSDFTGGIDNYYTDNFKHYNKTIKSHHAKYAPAWKTLEFFTFGTISNIYKNVKDEEIKKRISNKFGVISYSKFKNLLETVILMRNICAHGDVLFDLKIPKAIAVIPDFNFNNGDRSSLDSCIKVIYYFLGQISVNRQLDMKRDIEGVFEGVKDNPDLKEIVIDYINYDYHILLT